MLFGLIKLSPTWETNVKSTLLLAAIMTTLGMLGSVIAGTVGIYLSLAVGFTVAALTMWYARELSLWLFNAKEVVGKEKPEGFDLKDMVNRLRKEKNIDLKVMPKVCIIESDALNAFATGRHRGHTAIAITTGLLKEAKRYTQNDMPKATRLVEAILCHELGHIINSDVQTKTAASIMVGSIRVLSEAFYHQTGQNKDRTFLQALSQFVLFYFVIPMTGTLLGLALSRSREFAADDVAKKCGRGKDMVEALKCLKNAKKVKSKSGEQFNALSSMLCASNHSHKDQKIADALKKKDTGRMKRYLLQFQALNSTHPPLKERIKRMKKDDTKSAKKSKVAA